ncbi:hypothetical protein B7463_g6215, partial [Scytalidium lignicola]
MGSVLTEAITVVDSIRDENLSFTDKSFAFGDEVSMSKLRSLAPIAATPGQTYLNAAFQPPMNLRVRKALDTFLEEAITLPHPKPIWQQRAAEAQDKLARYLNVPTSSLTFTRDTTEGLNLFQRSIEFQPGSNVVILEDEHPNHAYGWLGLVNQGLEVKRIGMNGATFANANTFAPFVDKKTVAIGISSVMFHTGQMNDIKDISATYKPRGIHILVDITQHIGVAPIDLTSWNVSAVAFACHKGLASPNGLGGLYINPVVLKSLKPAPPIVGAGAIANLPASLVADPNVKYHETTKRYEHLNTSLLAAAALKASLTLITEEIGVERLERYLRSLGRELALRCQRLGVKVVGSELASRRAPHVYVLVLLHPGWQKHFQDEKVYVSHYRCGVRVSFGFYNIVEDIDAFARSIQRGIENGIPPE